MSVVTVALAGTTPWLFELGRVAFEVSMEPLVLCALLLALDRACRHGGGALWLGAPVGLALGALTYVYEPAAYLRRSSPWRSWSAAAAGGGDGSVSRGGRLR